MSKVKFLLIRFSSIGDIVLTSPVVRMLKEQVENAEVHFLTKKNFSEIVKHNPYIDEVHLFDNNLKETVNILRDCFFDYIIDLHHNLRTYRIKKRLGVLAFSFNKINVEKWLYVNFKINKLPDKHIVDRYLESVSLFDINNDNKGLDFFIPEKDEVDINILPSSFRKGFVGLVIGAQHYTKRLTVRQLIKLCKIIKYKIVIMGGKGDLKEAEKIKKELGDNIFNACGKFNINQSASLVKQAKLIITHDTGLMHIAAAFGKIIFSIWGNTVPEFGMYPYMADKRSEIFQLENLKCRPCSKIGHSKCPKKHFKCMENIDVQKIGEKVNLLMRDTE